MRTLVFIMTVILLSFKGISRDVYQPSKGHNGQYPHEEEKVGKEDKWVGPVSGMIKTWYPLELSFTGPLCDAASSKPNPFSDFRLEVDFTAPSGKSYKVAGFFNGDGKLNNKGNQWVVRFSPGEAGTWRWKARMVEGRNVAIEDMAGKTVSSVNGKTGTFTVVLSGNDDPEFYRRGLLRSTGAYYLQFADGHYWIKAGTDSPEDFLGYSGFGDVALNPAMKSRSYEGHVADWMPGDPDWGNGQGKGIIGALNYLSGIGVNSIYFLTMNIGGDCKNVWPYFDSLISPAGSPANDNLHFDIRKLAQWEIVLRHAQERGIFLHFALEEGETACHKELDGGKLGIERKLYYREIVARFGHHPALQWNISEEYDMDSPGNPLVLTPDLVKEFASYIKKLDPYSHPVTVHNNKDQGWDPFFGNKDFDIVSFQYIQFDGEVHYADRVEQLREQSGKSGFVIPIGLDEFSQTIIGDNETFIPGWPMLSGAVYQRKNILWPVLLSGGNIEFITYDDGNFKLFSDYESLWKYLNIARRFVQECIPFWKMEPADSLASGPGMEKGRRRMDVFAKKADCYAIYIPNSSSGVKLDLSGDPATFTQHWYNPRTGSFEGDILQQKGGSVINLGPPPSDEGEDWTVLLIADKE